MKKFLLFFAVALLVGCAKDYTSDFNAIDERLDKLELSVPTIEEQIESIQTSIASLEEVDGKLKESIKALEASDKATAEEIAALKEADKTLESRIAELQKYVDDSLKSVKDWVVATFATLEQLNALSSEVVALKNLVDANKIEAAANLATAISNLETSLKSWVGEQLSHYYTIAEVEAKITALQTAITEGDNALQEELNKLKTQLEITESEITAAYKKAIEEAINTNNGVINNKIAGEIATVNQRIDSEVATINAKIAELQAQVNQNTENIAKLLARIQSVSYIPTYEDGKATVKYLNKISQVTLDFKISPKSAVAELATVWQTAVSVEAIYTQTRVMELINMPIVSFNADAENGIISITTSGENLSEAFFAGTQTAKVAISISDDNNAITSDYISMIAAAATGISEFVVPINEIWYTSTDDTVVEPYKAEVFGANIVSNTYEDGQGIILFNLPITSIGAAAFSGCTSLTSVTIPNSVTSIGNSAFYRCLNLSSVTIPDSVISIGNYAFEHCKLASITIPNSVTSIGDVAFFRCNSLTSVTIPDSVTKIGEGVFSSCDKLEYFYGKFASNDNRCLIVGNTLNTYAAGSTLVSYTIPEHITIIGGNAFEYCKSLTSVTIPDSVTSIGDNAFNDCSSLTSVTIPDSVISIGTHAFSGCSSLTIVTIGNSVTSIGDFAFWDCDSLTSITIPDNVSVIGSAIFGACGKLEYFYGKLASNDNRFLIVGNTLNTYAAGSTLSSYTIPEHITAVDRNAFQGNDYIKSVTIPDSVTSIGAYAFLTCSSLTSVTIGNGVTKIGVRAFGHCTSLTSVYCEPTTPPSGGNDMFYNNASGRKIYAPTESVDAYKTADGWSGYADAIEGYDF